MAEIIIPDGVRYHLYAASVGQLAFAYAFGDFHIQRFARVGHAAFGRERGHIEREAALGALIGGGNINA